MLAAKNSQPDYFNGYVNVLVSFLILTIMWIPAATFGVFLKPVTENFGWTRAITSSAYSSSFLLFGLLGVVMGRLNDKFGPRLIIIVASLLVSLGYLLMWQISALWQLYVSYGLMMGMGSGGSFVPAASTIARWFVKRRGLMTSIVLSGVSAATTLGSMVVGWLSDSYGWRTAYLVIGISSLLLIPLLAQLLKRDPDAAGQSPYGQDEVRQEDVARNPASVTFQEAMRTPQFWMLCLTYLCLGVSIMVIIVHIVPNATDLGISSAVAPSLLAVLGCLQIMGRISLGVIADKISNKRTLIISLIVLSTSFIWRQIDHELWVMYIFVSIFGFASGGVGMLLSTVVAELFGLKAHGAILGMINLLWAIGGAVGPTLAGYIFDMSNSYSQAFIICAVLSFAPLLIVALLLKPIAYKHP